MKRLLALMMLASALSIPAFALDTGSIHDHGSLTVDGTIFAGTTTITGLGTQVRDLNMGGFKVLNSSTVATDPATNLATKGYVDQTTASTSFSETFTNSNLVAGVLTVVHNLGADPVITEVFDNTKHLIWPDFITNVDTATTTVDLTSFSVIPGTWSLIIKK